LYASPRWVGGIAITLSTSIVRGFGQVTSASGRLADRLRAARRFLGEPVRQIDVAVPQGTARQPERRQLAAPRPAEDGLSADPQPIGHLPSCEEPSRRLARFRGRVGPHV
jgi:hypothetical protein